MRSTDLARYLDSYLNIARYPDSSANGLQMQGADEVHTVALAVDASLETFRHAASMNAQMLVVHHGLFWGQHQQLTGAHYARVKTLFDANIGLYACHIPLDAHPEVGNNIELARIAGLSDIAAWGPYKGTTIGMIGNLPEAITPDALVTRFGHALGPARLVQRARGVAAVCKRIAVCSGLGVGMMDDALLAGADTLVTGETSHQWHPHVAERDLTVIYLGHYASETVGVKALGRHLEAQFGLDTRFIDVPTGL